MPMINPPAYVRRRVISRIARMEYRRSAVRFSVLLTACSVSTSVTAVAIVSVSQELARSGFYSYLALLGSDSNVILASWHDFALSLIEALPVANIAFALAAATALFFSLPHLVRAMRELRRSREYHVVLS